MRLLLFLATAVALHGQNLAGAEKAPGTPGTAADKNAPLPPPPPIDDGTVSHQGYTQARYETLWTRSPFAVETPEAAPDSPDYSLVGVAEVEGVTYASLIQKQNGEHFLISSAKPERGLQLTSIKRGKGEGDDTTATISRNGEILSLKLEQGPMTAPGSMPGAGSVATMPGSLTPQLVSPVIPMPGSTMQQPTRPLIRIHRPPIHVPPRPAQPAPPENTPPPAPAPAPAQ
jgi:hypothetical protein